MEKVLFKDYLENHPKDRKICVGSKSSFFYIGVPDYKKVEESLEEYKEAVVKNQKENLKETIRMATNAFDPTVYKKDSEGNKTEEIDKKATEAKMMARLNDFYTKYSAYLSNCKYLKHYKPLEERFVKETRSRRFVDKNLIIQIEGEELGDLWWEGEHDDVR